MSLYTSSGKINDNNRSTETIFKNFNKTHWISKTTINQQMLA